MRLILTRSCCWRCCCRLRAWAQDYPSRPIRLIVAFAPGGVVDTAARVLSMKMTERLGWQFVVDNRTGGNGLIGNGIAAKAPPDGHTILLAHTGEFAINQWVFKNIPFDIENDFVPVTMVNDGPMLVVVNSQSPIGSFKDLIAAAKAKPGALAFGSPGSGAVNHLATEWMAAAAGHQAPARAVQGRRARRVRSRDERSRAHRRPACPACCRTWRRSASRCSA